MIKPTCATCAFWDPFKDVRGLCRVGRPVVGDPVGWKLTNAGDWCGEHSNFQAFLGFLEESSKIPPRCPSMLANVRCLYPDGHLGAHAFDVYGDRSLIRHLYLGDGALQVADREASE